MSIRIKVKGTQGRGMQSKLRRLRVIDKHGGYKLGWPGDATYPARPKNEATGRPASTGGQTVSQVALWNEFGIPGRIPERPFFRNANKVFAKSAGGNILRFAKDGAIDRAATRRLAMIHGNDVQESITELNTPPNAALTRAWKQSANPLVDTGLMTRTITHELIT